MYKESLKRTIRLNAEPFAENLYDWEIFLTRIRIQHSFCMMRNERNETLVK